MESKIGTIFFFRLAFVLFAVEQNCNRTRCISDVNVMQSWLPDQPKPSSMERRPPANMIEIKFNVTLSERKTTAYISLGVGEDERK